MKCLLFCFFFGGSFTPKRDNHFPPRRNRPNREPEPPTTKHLQNTPRKCQKHAPENAKNVRLGEFSGSFGVLSWYFLEFPPGGGGLVLFVEICLCNKREVLKDSQRCLHLLVSSDGSCSTCGTLRRPSHIDDSKTDTESLQGSSVAVPAACRCARRSFREKKERHHQ